MGITVGLTSGLGVGVVNGDLPKWGDPNIDPKIL